MHKLLILLALSASAEAIVINEVMYNPLDEGNEFVELVGLANHTNLTVGDDYRNDTLALTRNESSNFSLVVADGFNLTTGNSSVYYIGSSIGNGLSNSGDSFYVYSGGLLIANVSYDGSYAREGYSLEYRNGSYHESLVMNGTPGLPNSEPGEVAKSEEASNSTKNITEEVCKVSLSLEAEGGVLHGSGEAFRYRHLVEGTDNFSVEYGIDDLFGAEVRESRTTSNEDWKQFTPDPELPVEAYVVWNRMQNPCGNGTLENSEIIVSKGKEDACSEEMVCSEFESEIGKLKRKVKSLESRPKPCSSGGGGYVLPEADAGIESFYTRKEKFDPVIKLFTRVSGNDVYEVGLTSTLEAYNRTVIMNGSETLELEVKAERGKNMYVLELRDLEGRREDVEMLVVEFPEIEEKETEEAVETSLEKKEKQVKEEETVVEKAPAATGRVVYESSKDVSPMITVISVLLALSLGGYAGIRYLKEEGLSNFYKRWWIAGKHGRKGRIAREGLDKSERDVRGRGQSEEARRGFA